MNTEMKRLHDLISGYDKEADKINSMKLGFLLSRASYGSLRDLISRYKEYVVGKFSFTVNCHDTGNSVVVDLISDDGERLNIINGTYWHNHSQYGFNKFHRLHGAWDDALEEAIDHIRTLEMSRLNNDFSIWTNKLTELKNDDKNTISKFEAEFN